MAMITQREAKSLEKAHRTRIAKKVSRWMTKEGVTREDFMSRSGIKEGQMRRLMFEWPGEAAVSIRTLVQAARVMNRKVAWFFLDAEDE